MQTISVAPPSRNPNPHYISKGLGGIIIGILIPPPVPIQHRKQSTIHIRSLVKSVAAIETEIEGNNIRH